MNEKKRQDLLKEIGIEKLENELNEYDWLDISKSGKLSEEFIREFQEKLWWDTLSEYQNFSEDFVREFSEKIHWYFLLNNHQVSESLIREFHNKIHWFSLSRRYIMSEEFVEEFKEKIFWESHFEELCADYNIIKKYIFRTNFKSTDEFETSHLSGTQLHEIDKLLKLKHLF